MPLPYCPEPPDFMPMPAMRLPLTSVPSAPGVERQTNMPLSAAPSTLLPSMRSPLESSANSAALPALAMVQPEISPADAGERDGIAGSTGHHAVADAHAAAAIHRQAAALEGEPVEHEAVAAAQQHGVAGRDQAGSRRARRQGACRSPPSGALVR